MQESFRAPEIFGIDSSTKNNAGRWLLLAARLVFWPLLLLMVAALALEMGAYRKEFKIAGPFAAESNPARRALEVGVPQEGRAPWWRQPLLGADSGKASQSFLELWIDGREMGPPHTLHETIREGTTTGFSHWGPRVIFSLPPGVKNAPETIATLRYPVRPRGWVTLLLVLLSALLGGLLYPRKARELARSLGSLVRHLGSFTRTFAPLAQSFGRPLSASVLRAPYLVLFSFCGVGVAASAVYIASSLYAFVTGWALPTTALIRWSPVARWAASNEPYLGYPLLMLAGFGTIVTWLLGWTAPQLVESNELRARRLLLWSGFPIAACAFVLCVSAMWAGMVRPGDLDDANIGGLVPFNDAYGHLAYAFDQARDGTWNAWVLRRPLAAAFRSILLFLSQYSFPRMLLLQGCLLGGAAWVASCAVMVWRGVWAGLGFFGLIYIYARIFSPTSLTEPLGLIWALLSIPFFIGAFRSGSVKPALVGFAILTFALLTRMGDMFAIPALLVWLVWQFGQGIAAKARIGLVAVGIVLGVFGLNSLLAKAYGNGDGSTGSNFSYTLCGLTLGTAWDGCQKKLEPEGSPRLPENVLIAKMYTMAWQNFKAQPAVFFHRLEDAVNAFYTRFPETIWKGYGQEVDEPEWFYRSALIYLLAAGILFAAVRRSNWKERTFWLLLCASLTVSAGFVFFDDGERVLAVSQPLIALFLATGFVNPLSKAGDAAYDRRLPLYGSAGLVLAAVSFAVVPGISHWVSSAYVAKAPESPTNDAFVFGGKRMSGFLVVANGDPLRSDIPTIHLSDFEAIVKKSDVEHYYQGLLHPVMPPLPFGFMFSPRAEKGAFSNTEYIVPAEVMERQDVPVWRFKFEPWRHKPDTSGNYWVHVTDAEPWPIQGR